MNVIVLLRKFRLRFSYPTKCEKVCRFCKSHYLFSVWMKRTSVSARTTLDHCAHSLRKLPRITEQKRRKKKDWFYCEKKNSVTVYCKLHTENALNTGLRILLFGGSTNALIRWHFLVSPLRGRGVASFTLIDGGRRNELNFWKKIRSVTPLWAIKMYAARTT